MIPNARKKNSKMAFFISRLMLYHPYKKPAIILQVVRICLCSLTTEIQGISTWFYPVPSITGTRDWWWKTHTIDVVMKAPMYAWVWVDIPLIAVFTNTSIQSPMAVTRINTSSCRHERTAKRNYDHQVAGWVEHITAAASFWWRTLFMRLIRSGAPMYLTAWALYIWLQSLDF
jgi:hypothetical protein